MNSDFIKENLPFASCIRYQGVDFVGIIQNANERIISFYDFESLRNQEEQKELISLGETWWWESSRTLPISVYLHLEMKNFKHCLKTFSAKDTEIVFGPVVSLNDLLNKRIKRRQIQFIKKV